MAVINTNTPQRLGGFKTFNDATRNAAINSSQRIVEAGVKERGFIITGNPENGEFKIGLKPTPEESVNDITNEARLFAYDVINDNDVRNACVWGTMSVDSGTAYQDEQYAYRIIQIN